MNTKVKINKRTVNLIIYFAIIIFAVLFLYVGGRIASDGADVGYSEDMLTIVEARISRILNVEEIHHLDWLSEKHITFEAVIARGSDRNRIVTAEQRIFDHFGVQPNTVVEGDRVVLISQGDEWHFAEHVRINAIIYLGVVFVILLLVFGRTKGLNAMLSLGFTCAAIFTVFIPSILSGRNIYISSIVICIYSVVVTLFILNGVNKKAFAAVAGCLGGILAAALLTFFMNGVLSLRGMINTDFMSLAFLPTENPIDLIALIFAGIIIGAVGAVMDVAVSVSSALWELKRQAPELPFSGIFKSGINIGRDIMGSMTNTLVLAYIGSSLSVILLLMVSSYSVTDLLSRELVIIELLKAIVGSLGILLTMPLTALICAALYSKGAGPDDEYDADDSDISDIKEYFSELEKMERMEWTEQTEKMQKMEKIEKMQEMQKMEKIEKVESIEDGMRMEN